MLPTQLNSNSYISKLKFNFQRDSNTIFEILTVLHIRSVGYVDTHIIIQNELVFQAHPKIAESHGEKKKIREFLQQHRE